MAASGWVLALLALLVAVASQVALRRERRRADALGRVEREVGRTRTELGTQRAAAERLQGALDAIPHGVVIGDGAGDVLFANDAAASFIYARHGEALVGAAIRELLVDAIAGRPATRTIDLTGPPRRVLEIVASPLPGDLRSGLIVVEDVSERRRLEAIRRDFVSNISHELKTPIGAIGLLAETLVDEPDVEVTQRLARRLVNEAFRVGRTIDDLLELSRIEAGEPPRREPASVEAVMAEAADRIRPAAELEGIDLRIEPVSARLSVLGDRRQLVSALYNLLDNAVKYSEPGSTVTLRAGAGVGSDGGRWIEMSVLDEGSGIPARDLDRIFERFYRVDQARSRTTGGTGLGLAIVRHVAANHDGTVSVESHEGRGSTFTLRIPAGPGPMALPSASPESPQSAAG